jgi:hypothetical protein
MIQWPANCANMYNMRGHLGSSISGGHCAIYTECSYACGACADADVAAHQGGRQGRLPAVNMIH